MMSLDGSAFNLRKGGVIQTVNRGGGGGEGIRTHIP